MPPSCTIHGILAYFENPAQIPLLRMPVSAESLHRKAVHNGGYARASYASGGSGASRVPRIAGDVTAGSALSAACWWAMCRARKGAAFDLLGRG